MSQNNPTDSFDPLDEDEALQEQRARRAVQRQLKDATGRTFEPGRDFEVVRTQDGVQPRFTDEYYREQIEAELESSTGEDIEPGRDFEVVRTEDGVEPRFTNEYRVRRLRDEVSAPIPEEAESAAYALETVQSAADRANLSELLRESGADVRVGDDPADIILGVDPEKIREGDETLPWSSPEEVRQAQQAIKEAQQLRKEDPEAFAEKYGSQQEFQEQLQLRQRVQSSIERGEERTADRISVQRQAAEQIEDVRPTDIETELADGEFQVAGLEADAKQRLRQQAAEQADVQPSDVSVQIDDGTLTTDLTESAQQARAVEQVETQLEENFGGDLQRGQDFTVEETDQGVRASVTDEFRRERAAEQLSEDTGRQVQPSDVTIDDGEVRLTDAALKEFVEQDLEEQVGQDLERGEDFTFQETEDGDLEARLTDEFRQQRAEDALESELQKKLSEQAIKYGRVDLPTDIDQLPDLEPGEDFIVQQTDDGFSAELTDQGRETFQEVRYGVVVGDPADLSDNPAVAAPVEEQTGIDLSEHRSLKSLIEEQTGTDLPDSDFAEQAVEDNTGVEVPEQGFIRRAVEDQTGIDIPTERELVEDIRGAITPQNVATAATVGVAAPEPITTGTGAAVLGGLAAAGITAEVVSRSDVFEEVEVPEEERESEIQVPADGQIEQTEIDTPEQTDIDQSEIEVPEERTEVSPEELGIPREVVQQGEVTIDGPDGTEITDEGEIIVPLGTTQVARQTRFEDEEEEEQDETEDDEQQAEDEEEVVVEVPEEMIPDEPVTIGSQTGAASEVEETDAEEEQELEEEDLVREQFPDQRQIVDDIDPEETRADEEFRDEPLSEDDAAVDRVTAARQRLGLDELLATSTAIQPTPEVEPTVAADRESDQLAATQEPDVQPPASDLGLDALEADSDRLAADATAEPATAQVQATDVTADLLGQLQSQTQAVDEQTVQATEIQQETMQTESNVFQEEPFENQIGMGQGFSAQQKCINLHVDIDGDGKSDKLCRPRPGLDSGQESQQFDAGDIDDTFETPFEDPDEVIPDQDIEDQLGM